MHASEDPQPTNEDTINTGQCWNLKGLEDSHVRGGFIRLDFQPGRPPIVLSAAFFIPTTRRDEAASIFPNVRAAITSIDADLLAGPCVQEDVNNAPREGAAGRTLDPLSAVWSRWVLFQHRGGE